MFSIICDPSAVCVMFSACGTTNPYGGRSNIKRKLFSKRKTHSSTSDGGIDLKKVKGKHCVETWASQYNQSLDYQSNWDSFENAEFKINNSNFCDLARSDSLVKLDNGVETQLALTVELNKEKECKLEEPEDFSR